MHFGDSISVACSPAWLLRLYAYTGADTNRYENERDRAVQRVVLPIASIAWVYLFHALRETSVAPTEAAWCIAVLFYAVSSAGYWVYLGRRPRGGVHAQHLYLAMDPIVVGLGLLAAPQALAWWQIFILIMVARVGLRYGLNAMKFELVFAWLGALLPVLFSSYWRNDAQAIESLLLMLAATWWLFTPLQRSLEKAQSLAVEDARVRALRESLRTKGEFLARVSHELRSPLQTVVSALDLMEARIRGNPDEVELMSRVRRGATILQAQLRDLLILAKGDVGRIEIAPVSFEACELVLSVARELEHEASAKNLQMTVELPVEPLFTFADPGRIDQVLTNLLSNAIRHTESGSVTLILHGYDEQTRCLRFSVRDSGPGVDTEHIPTMFDPFTRFGVVTSRGDGAGLGLAVVRSILQALHGSIRVVSERRRGTEFHVDIPAELVESAPHGPVQTGRSQS